MIQSWLSIFTTNKHIYPIMTKLVTSKAIRLQNLVLVDYIYELKEAAQLYFVLPLFVSNQSALTQAVGCASHRFWGFRCRNVSNQSALTQAVGYLEEGKGWLAQVSNQSALTQAVGSLYENDEVQSLYGSNQSALTQAVG